TVPIFIGRDSELDRLVGILKKRNKGALFVGGENGSGKTSTVYSALDSLEKKVLVVPLNHLFLYKNSNGSDLTLELTRQLVRSLYLAVEKELFLSFWLPQELKSLHNDVNLKSLIKKENQTDTRKREFNGKISLSVNPNLFKTIVKLTPAILFS